MGILAADLPSGPREMLEIGSLDGWSTPSALAGDRLEVEIGFHDWLAFTGLSRAGRQREAGTPGV